MKDWYLLRNDKTHGPYADELIVDMIHAKEIGLIDLIREKSESNWSIISDREEFSRLFTDEILDFEVGNQWVLLKKIGKDWIQYGPFTDIQVEVMLKHGKIKYSDWIWKTGFKRWYQIYSLSEFTANKLENKESSKEGKRSTLDEKKILSEVFLMESPDIVNEYGVQNSNTLKPPEDLTKQDLKEHLIKKVVRPSHLSSVKINDFKESPRSEVRNFGKTINYKLLGGLLLGALLFFGLGKVISQSASKQQEPPVEVKSAVATFLSLEIEDADKPAASIKIASDIPVLFSLRSVPGYHLNTKSFIYEKELDEATFFLLNNFDMKPGQYWVKAQAGDRVETKTFFLGETSKEYLAKLWSHNKKMSAFHQNEKELLYDDIMAMQISLRELIKHYNQENAEDFKLTVEKGWRPGLKNSLSKPLLSWNQDNASQYVHPGLWIENHRVYNELLSLSQDFNAPKVSKLIVELSKMKTKVNQLTIN